MKDQIQAAEKVVLGRIVQKTAVYSANNSKNRCGWNIDFKVDREFKGGTEDFIFFTTDEDTFYNESDQYMIIANTNNNYGKKGRKGTIFCNPYAGMMGASTENEDYVNVSDYEYMANSFWDNGSIAILPVDTKATKEYSGTWVRVPGHYKLITSALRREIPAKKNYHGLTGSDVTVLIKLEELIDEALGKNSIERPH